MVVGAVGATVGGGTFVDGSDEEEDGDEGVWRIRSSRGWAIEIFPTPPSDVAASSHKWSTTIALAVLSLPDEVGFAGGLAGFLIALVAVAPSPPLPPR